MLTFAIKVNRILILVKEGEYTMDKEIQKNQQRKIRLKPKYKVTLVIIAISIFIIYFIGFMYFNDKFLSHTTINNIDVSKLTIKQTHQKLNEKIQNHSLDLMFIDKTKETLSITDCGIQYNEKSPINTLYKQQNHWLWFMSFFKTENLELDQILTIQEQKLMNSIESLNHLNKEKQIAPVNAKITYKDKKFTIIKEEVGSTIDKNKLKEIIISAFSHGKSQVNVLNENGYILPKITSKDKKLNHLLEASQKYANASITYQTTSGNVVLDGNTIMSWLSIDESGNYYRDDKTFKENATKFVKELAKKINNIGTKKTFTVANGRRVTVNGGNYGLKLKQSQEVEELLKDIKASKHGIRKPVTSGVQASYTNNGLGHTYAEVDLTKQHIYYVKNGKVILESDCVTGKHTDPERRTPAGTYYLYFKQRNRVLRGTRLPNGQWPYETPVSYWMAFNVGIGFHDASWRHGKFGGNIYINDGSHGCINLPPYIAKQLYENITTKTPVVVHY